MESPPEFIGFSRAKKDVRVHQLNITVSWDRLLEEELIHGAFRPCFNGVLPYFCRRSVNKRRPCDAGMCEEDREREDPLSALIFLSRRASVDRT